MKLLIVTSTGCFNFGKRSIQAVFHGPQNEFCNDVFENINGDSRYSPMDINDTKM